MFSLTFQPALQSNMAIWAWSYIFIFGLVYRHLYHHVLFVICWHNKIIIIIIKIIIIASRLVSVPQYASLGDFPAVIVCTRSQSNPVGVPPRSEPDDGGDKLALKSKIEPGVPILSLGCYILSHCFTCRAPIKSPSLWAEGVNRKSPNDSPREKLSQLSSVDQFLHYSWHLFCLGDMKLLYACMAPPRVQIMEPAHYICEVSALMMKCRCS